MEKVSKHDFYQKSVQSVKVENEFFKKIFRMIYNKLPYTLREDFCGTGLLASSWTNSSVENYSVGIDIDQEALDYGKEKNVTTDRVRLINHNVLKEFDKNEKFDIICSLNYSHFLLTKRTELKTYFKNVFNNISRGILILDFFGGSHVYENHSFNKMEFYQFSGKAINIMNSISKCSLNYKIKKNKFKTMFTYEFRVYTIIEMREALEEVGFTKFKIYIKEINEDDEDDYTEYEEIEIDGEYYPESERYTGYIVAYIE